MPTPKKPEEKRQAEEESFNKPVPQNIERIKYDPIFEITVEQGTGSQIREVIYIGRLFPFVVGPVQNTNFVTIKGYMPRGKATLQNPREVLETTQLVEDTFSYNLIKKIRKIA